jgi:hypothetical protein
MVLNSQRRPSLERLVFTSDLIYKYTRIESQYSKETRQRSRNAPEGTRGDDASTAEENESNGRELTHACTYLWRGSREESGGRGLYVREKVRQNRKVW